MLSFGLAVLGHHDGVSFEATDPAKDTFYAELEPISDAYQPEALAVSGLDRDHLTREGRAPNEAMAAAASWIVQVADGRSPVFAAYPLGYDWMWMYWYFVRYTSTGSPFGHSHCLDIKTLYATKAATMITRATKGQMPDHLLSNKPHTHNALDDAIEQAELCQNLMRWTPRK